MLAEKNRKPDAFRAGCKKETLSPICRKDRGRISEVYRQNVELMGWNGKHED
jgi:hypothetical protein